MWTKLDDDGRITCTTPYKEFADEDMQDLDIFPKNFDFANQSDYRVVDGKLVLDPPPIPPEIQLMDLKAKMDSTNDIVLQAYEAKLMGETLDEATSSAYAEVIANRAQWRKQIAEIEAQLKGGE